MNSLAHPRLEKTSSTSVPHRPYPGAGIAQMQALTIVPDVPSAALDRGQLRARLVPLLAGLVPEWEFEGWDERLDDDTQLIADLGLTSIEFVDLFVGLEKSVGRGIGFHDLLMVDGRYISDLRLGDLIDFALGRLQSPGKKSTVPAVPEPAPVSAAVQVDDAMIERFRMIVPCPRPASPPARKNGPMLFVLTAPRSGSTLLQTILAGHPDLFAPPELHLLWYNDLKERQLAFQAEANRHLTSGAIRALMELDGLTVDAARDLMERYEAEQLPVSTFYGMLQERVGDRLLVDKTPSNALSLEVLERAESLFDRPLYLHLVRHPGGMVRSFMDAHLERVAPFMVKHADEFDSSQFGELTWLHCNQNIMRFLDQVPRERQHLVHYEDIVGNSEAALRKLCDFLQLDFVPAMLDPYHDKSQRMADGLDRVGEMSGDLKFHLHESIDPEAASRWQRFLSEDALSARTWALAESTGYQRGA